MTRNSSIHETWRLRSENGGICWADCTRYCIGRCREKQHNNTTELIWLPLQLRHFETICKGCKGCKGVKGVKENWRDRSFLQSSKNTTPVHEKKEQKTKDWHQRDAWWFLQQLGWQNAQAWKTARSGDLNHDGDGLAILWSCRLEIGRKFLCLGMAEAIRSSHATCLLLTRRTDG